MAFRSLIAPQRGHLICSLTKLALASSLRHAPHRTSSTVVSLLVLVVGSLCCDVAAREPWLAHGACSRGLMATRVLEHSGGRFLFHLKPR